MLVVARRRRGRRRAQRVPRRLRRAAVARGHDRHARALPRARASACSAPRRSPTSRVAGPRSASSRSRTRTIAVVDRALRRAGRRVRRGAARHAVRPRRSTRSACNAEAAQLRRRQRRAHQVPAVRAVRASSSAFAGRLLHAALRQRPRRRRHRPRAHRHRGRAARRRLDLRRPRRAASASSPAAAHRRLPPARCACARSTRRCINIVIGVLLLRRVVVPNLGESLPPPRPLAAPTRAQPSPGSTADAGRRALPAHPPTTTPTAQQRQSERMNMRSITMSRRRAVLVTVAAGALGRRGAAATPPPTAAEQPPGTERPPAPPARRRSAVGRAQPDIEQGLTIYFLPKNRRTPTSTPTRAARRRVEEFGGTLVVRSGTEDTAAAQVPSINTAIAEQGRRDRDRRQRPGRAVPSLQQAGDAGIKVVTFDSDINRGCRDLFINQADTAEASPRPRSTASPSRSAARARSRSSRPPPTRRTRTPGSSYMKKELEQVPEHQARRHRLRRRRRPDVVRQGRRACCRRTRTSRASSRRPPSASRRRPATCRRTRRTRARSQLTGLGLPTQMAPVRQGRHRQGLRAVEPGRPRLPRRRTPRRRSSPAIIEREAGDTFTRRQARRRTPSRRRRRTRDPRTADRLQRRQHRRLRLLTGRGGRPGAVSPAPGTPPVTDGRPMTQRVCFQLQVRAGPARGVRGAPRGTSGRTCCDALRDAGWRNYSLFLARRRPADRLRRERRPRGGPGGDGRHRRERAAGRPRWPTFFVDLDGRPPDDRTPLVLERSSTSTDDGVHRDCSDTQRPERRRT